MSLNSSQARNMPFHFPWVKKFTCNRKIYRVPKEWLPIAFNRWDDKEGASRRWLIKKPKISTYQLRKETECLSAMMQWHKAGRVLKWWRARLHSQKCNGVREVSCKEVAKMQENPHQRRFSETRGIIPRFTSQSTTLISSGKCLPCHCLKSVSWIQVYITII